MRLGICAAIGTALPRNMGEFNAFRIVAGVAIGLAAPVVVPRDKRRVAVGTSLPLNTLLVDSLTVVS